MATTGGQMLWWNKYRRSPEPMRWAVPWAICCVIAWFWQNREPGSTTTDLIFGIAVFAALVVQLLAAIRARNDLNDSRWRYLVAVLVLWVFPFGIVSWVIAADVEPAESA